MIPRCGTLEMTEMGETVGLEGGDAAASCSMPKKR
jgi:hypothetical protein